MFERRQEPRAQAVFKSAYVQTSDGLEFVTLRNISDSGLCFDSWPGAAEGDEVEFCIDSNGLRKGTVRWVKGGLCGINSTELSPSQWGSQMFPSRSVRLPLSVPAQLYLHGRSAAATLHNLSIRGACIRSEAALVRGQLVSLQIANACFERADVRWERHGLFGLRFADPVHPSVFRDLVSRLQKQPASHTDAVPAFSCTAKNTQDYQRLTGVK